MPGFGLRQSHAPHERSIAPGAAFRVVHAHLDGGDAHALPGEHRDSASLVRRHGVGRELPLRRRRLVRRDARAGSRRLRGRASPRRRRAEGEADRGETRRRMAPVSSSRTTSMIVPSRSRIATRDHFTLSHFVALLLELRVADEQVPHDGANPSVCGVIRSAETVGMTTHASATCFRVTAVAPDDAEHLGADFARELERPHEVHADVLLAVAAADAEDEDAVARAQAESRGATRRSRCPSPRRSPAP